VGVVMRALVVPVTVAMLVTFPLYL